MWNRRIITPKLITGKTEKASPVSADKVLISDSEASDILKYAQLGNLPGGSAGGMWTPALIGGAHRWEPTVATDSHTFSGLDGDSDIRYKIVSRIVGSGSTGQFFARPNDDSATNYNARVLDGWAATDLENNRYATWTGIDIGYNGDNSTQSYNEAIIYAKSGINRPALVSWVRFSDTVGQGVGHFGILWLNTSSNITSISINAPSGGYFNVGSSIELWKLAA